MTANRRRGSITPLGRWVEASGISYEELADRAGMSRRSLISAATGEALLSTSHVLRLMRETKLSFADLVMSSPMAALSLAHQRRERETVEDLGRAHRMVDGVCAACAMREGWAGAAGPCSKALRVSAAATMERKGATR